MDGQNGVAGVIRIEKKCPELRFGQFLLKNGEGRGDVGIDVLPLPGEIQENLDLFLLGVDLVEKPEVAFKPFLVLLEGLERLLVLPTLGIGEAAVQGIEVGFFAIEVKENLGVPRT